MLRIDARSSRELQAIVLAVRGMPAELRKQVRQHTKELGQPEWQSTVRAETITRLENRILGDNARMSVSDQNIRLSAAAVGKKLSGGLTPQQGAGPVEYGGSPAKKTTYTARRRKSGKSYSVTRRSLAQFRPRARDGYVFGPAVRRFVPRAASLWAQTVVRTIGEALEGKHG